MVGRGLRADGAPDGVGRGAQSRATMPHKSVDDINYLRYGKPVESMMRREFLEMVEEIRRGIIRQWQQKDRKAEEDGP